MNLNKLQEQFRLMIFGKNNQNNYKLTRFEYPDKIMKQLEIL